MSAPRQGPDAAPPLVGASPAMLRVGEQATRAAKSAATVLLRGETGTGKDVVARTIHHLSDRAAKPFVEVHCAALPEALLESELFGYEKGAFTGANERKLGRVALAEGGTLFLDEIGDLTPPTQVKLLRLLQDRAYEPLGGVRTHHADVRVMAATHRNLEGLTKDGAFREDLFYRLNVIPIWLPPLRSRRADIELLARHFASQVGAENDKPLVALDAEALTLLRKQRWPGNVRELRNFVERLVVLTDHDVLTAADIEREKTQSAPFQTATGTGSVLTAASSTDGAPVVPLDAAVREAERKAIERALAHTRGNRKLAARLLGVSRATLYNKLADLGFDKDA